VKKREETYQLTFKGFVLVQMDMSEEKTSQFLDALELWLRRTDQNAVILTKSSGFESHRVYLEEK
jgi:hypothetical protein